MQEAHTTVVVIPSGQRLLPQSKSICMYARCMPSADQSLESSVGVVWHCSVVQQLFAYSLSHYLLVHE